MLVQLGLNLRGAPYELVPVYFVNTLLVFMTSRVFTFACAFAQSHQGLAAHLHKVWSGWRLERNKILNIYVRFVLYSWISISYKLGGFLRVNNSIIVVITAIPIVSTYSNIKFLKIEHFNKLFSRSRRVLLSSWNYIRKILSRDSVRTDAHTKK